MHFNYLHISTWYNNRNKDYFLYLNYSIKRLIMWWLIHHTLITHSFTTLLSVYFSHCHPVDTLSSRAGFHPKQKLKLIVMSYKVYATLTCCLWRTLKITWEQRVTNTEVAKKTGTNNIKDEDSKRRWKWLGYGSRMQKRHHYAAL